METSKVNRKKTKWALFVLIPLAGVLIAFIYYVSATNDPATFPLFNAIVGTISTAIICVYTNSKVPTITVEKYPPK